MATRVQHGAPSPTLRPETNMATYVRVSRVFILLSQDHHVGLTVAMLESGRHVGLWSPCRIPGAMLLSRCHVGFGSPCWNHVCHVRVTVAMSQVAHTGSKNIP